MQIIKLLGYGLSVFVMLTVIWKTRDRLSSMQWVKLILGIISAVLCYAIILTMSIFLFGRIGNPYTIIFKWMTYLLMATESILFVFLMKYLANGILTLLLAFHEKYNISQYNKGLIYFINANQNNIMLIIKAFSSIAGVSILYGVWFKLTL